MSTCQQRQQILGPEGGRCTQVWMCLFFQSDDEKDFVEIYRDRPAAASEDFLSSNFSTFVRISKLLRALTTLWEALLTPWRLARKDEQ